MRARLAPIAAGALLALAALLVILVLAPSVARTEVERAEALAAELRCPDCQGLSVADSQTSAAHEIRRQIGTLVADGASDDEVRDHFIARYGEWILLAPRSPVTWLVPFAIVAAAALLLGWWLIRRREDAGTTTPRLPTDRERAALAEEIEAIDG